MKPATDAPPPAEAAAIAAAEPAPLGPLAPALLVDLDALMRRTDHLPPEGRAAYCAFLLRLWRWGEVFSAEADLARAFGLRLRSFRRLRDPLARLFTIDLEGGWHVPEVEAQRVAGLARQGRAAGAGEDVEGSAG